MNELIFLLHSTLICSGALLSLKIGREALTAFIAITCILANLFVLKQITLWGFHVTATDAYIIGAVLGINLINEYYGRESARKALFIAFGAAVFTTLLSQIHLAYIPNCFDISHNHFCALFNVAPRIVVASLTAYLISQTTEYALYNWLKERSGGNYLVLRNWFSLSISQLIDTVLFSFLGLYGIISNIWNIILVSYLIKLIAIGFTGPFIWLSKKIIHQTKQEA